MKDLRSDFEPIFTLILVLRFGKFKMQKKVFFGVLSNSVIKKGIFSLLSAPLRPLGIFYKKLYDAFALKKAQLIPCTVVLYEL